MNQSSNKFLLLILRNSINKIIDNKNTLLNRKNFLININNNQNNFRTISTTLFNNCNNNNNNNNNKQQINNNSIFSSNVNIDGQKIHYELAGNGEHVLLLMPGALGTGRNDFLGQLKGLDGSLFKMIAWDPPGYGKSRPPERDFNDFYNRDAIMAAKLMKKLNYEKYSILGWSDGGITGIILAANNTENIQKLIIWGSNAYICDEDRELLIKVRNARTDWSEKQRLPMIEIYGEEQFYQLWDRFISYMLTLKNICKKELKEIKCPVLILHGDQDRMISSEHPIYLVNNIPNATLFRFKNGKHNIHQRFVDEFNQLCVDFLLTK